MKCPACEREDQKVPNETVWSLIQTDYLSKVGEYDYFLCMNPDCSIAYYNAESVFEKSTLEVPLWCKKMRTPSMH